ncbi:hypothetical protein [Micromonospora zhanjiangensis]|uniref:Lipoprotein n=1 Tax=Micromonospora zhanjiangensis TaxID=1522057 RepID=A0ABV8KFG1_9ACTN
MRRHTGATALIRRGTVTLTALAVTVAGVSGCGAVERAGSAGSASPAPSASKSPKEILLASVPDDAKGPVRFSGKDATNDITGSVDPAAKAIQLNTSIEDPEHRFTMQMGYLIIGQQVWMKVSFKAAKGVTGLPKLPNKWLKLDPAKVTDKDATPAYDGADQGNAGHLFNAATTVQDKGNGEYAGVIDLTDGTAAQVLDADQMKALGQQAKSIPFRATLGPDHNLASLTMDVPAAGKNKAFTYVVKYSEYGHAPKLGAPAADQAQDAPAAAYDLLNG